MSVSAASASSSRGISVSESSIAGFSVMCAACSTKWSPLFSSWDCSVRVTLGSWMNALA